MDLLERPGLPQVFYHSVLKHPNYKLEDPRFDKLEDPRFEYYSENSIVRYSFKNASAIYSIHHISRKLPGLTFTISINIIIAGMDNNCKISILQLNLENVWSCRYVWHGTF